MEDVGRLWPLGFSYTAASAFATCNRLLPDTSRPCRMAFSLFSKNKKALLDRCRDDPATKMRLKYAPFYHAIDAQRGTDVRLDGRDMIMLSSNDYLGLSFHPKVIEAGPRRHCSSGVQARPGHGHPTVLRASTTCASRRKLPLFSAARPVTCTPPATCPASPASPPLPKRAT